MDQPPKTPSIPGDSIPPEGEDDAATKVSELPADLLELGLAQGSAPETFVEPTPSPAVPPTNPAPPPAVSVPTLPEPIFPPGRAALPSVSGLAGIQVRPATAGLVREDESVDTSAETHLNQLPADLMAQGVPRPGAAPLPQPFPGSPVSPFVPASAQGQGPPGFAAPPNPPGPPPFQVSQGGFPMPPPPFAGAQGGSLSNSGIVWAIGGIAVGLVLVALIVLALYLLLGR